MDARSEEGRTNAGSLVLWDIDHTLIKTTDHDRLVYQKVLADFLQTSSPISLPESGKGLNEHAIVTEVLINHGFSPARCASALPTLLASMEQELAVPSRLRRFGALLPGAKPLLEANQRGGGSNVPLTGNLRRVGEAKLAAFNLARFMRVDIGGYATEHTDKAVLVNRVIARSAHSPRTAIVIGDSTTDIAAAVRNGISSIGVATGATPADALKAAGATAVVADLTDCQHLLSIIKDCSR